MIESSSSVQPENAAALKRKRNASWLHRARKAVLRTAAYVFAHTLAPLFLRLYAMTWRWVRIAPERRDLARTHGTGVIHALWHGRMLLAIPAYRGEDMTTLASNSGDGDLAGTLVEGYGYRCIRGSKSQGGARALRAMIGALRAGSNVVITPDGPRGPRHSMNPGIAWMARATGFAVLPTGFAVDRAWYLSSWDRYTVPKPFARVALAYGEPIYIERRASPEELERATERIRSEIMLAEDEARRRLGVESEP